MGLYGDLMAEQLPEGWTCAPDGAVLTCPHGHRVEPDGRCPDGCVSPLRKQGLI